MFWKVGLGLGAIGLTLGLVACGAANQATASVVGTPAATQQQTNRSARGTSGGPNVVGTVQAVNGSTITVQRPGNGGSVTVQVTGSTTIRKQVERTINDVKAGQAIVAFGQQNGGAFQARQIQLGVTQGPAGPRGDGGSAGRAGARGGSIVSGTVDGVSGSTITVKSDSGTSVQVQLAANGRIVEQTTGSASDVKQGDVVFVAGQLQGNVMTATSLDISTGFPGRANAAPRAGS